MRISRDLHLVIPIERADDYTVENVPGKLYAHSAPISAAVFESWHLMLAKTFSEIMAGGLGIAGGPRVAASILQRQCEIERVWEGQNGAELGLIGEMLRLTNIMAQDSMGKWLTLPWDQAIATDMMFDEDVSEVRNAIVFFSVLWRMQKRQSRAATVTAGIRLWGGALSSLNATEYVNSLPTPKSAATIGEPAPTTEAASKTTYSQPT